MTYFCAVCSDQRLSVGQKLSPVKEKQHLNSDLDWIFTFNLRNLQLPQIWTLCTHERRHNRQIIPSHPNRTLIWKWWRSSNDSRLGKFFSFTRRHSWNPALTENISWEISTCHDSNDIRKKKTLNILSEMVSRQHRCMRLCLKIVPVSVQRAKKENEEEKKQARTHTLKTGAKTKHESVIFGFCCWLEELKIHHFVFYSFFHCVPYMEAAGGKTHILSLGTHQAVWQGCTSCSAVCSFLCTCHSLLASYHGTPPCSKTHLVLNNDSAN